MPGPSPRNQEAFPQNRFVRAPRADVIGRGGSAHRGGIMSASGAAAPGGAVVVSGGERERAIGSLQTVIGSVAITRANLRLAAYTGDFIHQGDIVETGEDGRVTIAFVDGTTLRLYANTRLVVEEFVGGLEGAPGSALVRIAKGMFAVVAGKLASAGRLIIETP